MDQRIATPFRWTTTDLEALPEDGARYEIVSGELQVTRSPHRQHQRVADKICAALNQWSEVTKTGEATTATGIIFSDTDNVIPDVVWISYDKLLGSEDEQGHLTTAPEIIVEVLSLGNESTDRKNKLRLYSTQGVQEYWIVDWRRQQIEVYRWEQAVLRLISCLTVTDELKSPLLPGFICSLAKLFA